MANYTVDGGRRISTITFGQPRCQTELKGMRALGLSVDVEAKQHDILGLVETNNEVFGRKADVREVSTLIVKGTFLWK